MASEKEKKQTGRIEKGPLYARRGSFKKKIDYGVYIKPVVIKEMNAYRDSNGNTRDREMYNVPQLIGGVSKFQITPNIGKLNEGTGSILYRAYVESEFERDEKNSIGPIKQKKKRGRIFNVRKPPEKKKFINYLVTAKFLEVNFSDDAMTLDTPQRFFGSGNNVYYAEMPTIKNNKVMLRCQCQDFIHTWSVALAKNNGLWPNSTAWTPYTRLTPISMTRYPVKNPDDRMGYCKHVETLLASLIKNGSIGNGQNK
jgi:hypothetical protein